MKTVSNTVVLMFILGWQGGTIHQVAKELNVTTDDILFADHEKMGTLMRIAQQKGKMQHAKVVTELRHMVECFKDTPREINCYAEAHINAARAALDGERT